MKRSIIPKTIRIKFPSFIPVPIYALCSFLLILGLYRLNGDSLFIDSASYTASQSVQKNTSEADFQNFLQNLFQKEVTSNTLSLHYTLADPASAKITQYPVTFGEITAEQEAAKMASLENIKKDLQAYDTSAMSTSARMTYDVLKDSINRSMELSSYYYYNELLSSTNGVQSEYPILLAEYAFYSKKDVDDYLTLLSQYDTYFKQVCDFEKEKAKRGFFMNETAANHLIEQCRAFIPDDCEKSFWETTFFERLNKISLSKKEKTAYKNQNHEILQEHVYPAYHNLIAVLKALKNKGKNPRGLCYFEDGKKYYQLLVKSSTGSNRPIQELQEMVEKQRDASLSELSALKSVLMKSTFSTYIKRKNNTNKSDASNLLLDKSPEDMLEHLKTEIQPAFPTPPHTDYTVKNVSKKLENFLSPAFYLTAPIDRFTENCIYINPGSNYDKLGLFTTLAHEGYPGHMYQTVYSYSKKLSPLRYLLYHGGYTEGWATYVEMLSFQYAGFDKNTARALMLNQDATLSLYATIDMGVHFSGWTFADTASFLGSYGVTDVSVISNIYQTIIENPANYLKYYIGYLEFLSLKEKADTHYGKNFSELRFHTAILDMGSAPFYILEKYLTKYYKAKK